jgi:mannose-1-phosphate guanylyltransferase/phosphomannomutase
VAVPFDRTGHVMRTLLADLGPADLVITDGVKVTHEDGWALVAPDPDAARLHVLAEAGSDIAAAERAEHYAALVRAVLTRPVDEPSRPASPVGDDSTMFSA